MAFTNPSREQIKDILLSSRTIAVVGLSDNPERISYMVSEAMRQKGYRIIPVNPNAQQILGERCYSSLTEIDFPIDIVNVFRRSDQTLQAAEDAVRIHARVLWLQQGIFNEDTAALAQANGLMVIMDRCIKVEDSILVPRR